MSYPSIQHASSLDLLNLRNETKNYLLFHIHQLESNQHLKAQISVSPSIPFQAPTMGYSAWLHLIGGGHIGAPIGLVWFAACAGSKVRDKGSDCFSTVKQKLMAWNANSHAAKQLRMFNDYGSVTRDCEERNLNSTDFPEFFGSNDREWIMRVADGADELDHKFVMMQRQKMLLDAALYERKRTNDELDELYAELRKEGRKGSKLADWLGLYYAGGDQFSDMYLLRDVTNSTK
jgi:hypothetical protein